MHDPTSIEQPTDSHVSATRAAAPGATGASLSLRAIRQVFGGGVVALEGIDLSVTPGEFLAVLGPSGCGKSTLLRLIAGLDRPSSGEVTVAYGASPNSGSATPPPGPPAPPDEGGGEGALLPSAYCSLPSDRKGSHPDPHQGGPEYRERGQEESARQTVRRGRTAPRHPAIAYVFQDAHLLPWRTVLNNVALPLELMHVPRSRRLAASLRAVERVGLADAAGRYPGQLSGGMRMRASLARALVTDPQLLLLDEPFAALDEITRQHLDEELRGLWADRGMTVVFVTHSTAEAAFLADRAVVMSRRPGRIVLDRRLELPPRRDGPLRATPAFVRETRFLYEALERGGA